MKDNKKIIISMILKSLLIIFVVVGILYNVFFGHVHGLTVLLFFTTQSNIWIMLVDILLLIFMIISIKKKTYILNNKLYILQEVFTVSITLTGIVYCFILVPAYYLLSEPIQNYTPFNLGGSLLHIVVPILALTDFFGFTVKATYKKTSFLWAVLPPAYYLCFSLLGYFLNWDFGGGNNYPYFFLNYNNPAGFFGFSKTMPYFMGNFYWYLVICGIVVGASAILIAISNKIKLKK